MRKFAIPLVAAASLCAGAALAQGSGFLGLGSLGGTGPFNGPYIGAQAGWQLDRERIDSAFDTGGYQVRPQNSGFRYGGQIGWDVKVAPRIVVGVEASGSGVTGADYGYDRTGLVYSVGQTFDATGRLGYLVTPTGLVYGKGGYTNSEFHFDDPYRRFVTHRGGYVVGGGYEQAVARHVSVGLEYDYSHFGGRDLPDYAYDIGALNARAYDTRHEVLAKVNFRF